MPIYEYKCRDCGKVFEIFQKISDKPLKECRFCKGKLDKLISNCSFQLKGTGWYVTDYKKPIDSVGKSPSSGNGSGSAGKTDTTADSTATSSSAETKAETKIEKKTEAASSS